MGPSLHPKYWNHWKELNWRPLEKHYVQKLSAGRLSLSVCFIWKDTNCKQTTVRAHYFYLTPPLHWQLCKKSSKSSPRCADANKSNPQKPSSGFTQTHQLYVTKQDDFSQWLFIRQKAWSLDWCGPASKHTQALTSLAKAKKLLLSCTLDMISVRSS